MKPVEEHRPTVITIQGNTVEIGAYLSIRDAGKLKYCTIPALDISFSAKDSEVACERAESAIKAFVEYWAVYNSRKEFYQKIYTLGFKAQSRANVVMSGQMKNERFENASVGPGGDYVTAISAM